MARTIHEVLDSDRDLYAEYKDLAGNQDRLDEMSAVMDGCNYSADFNLMRRALNLTLHMLEFERRS